MREVGKRMTCSKCGCYGFRASQAATTVGNDGARVQEHGVIRGWVMACPPRSVLTQTNNAQAAAPLT